MAKKYVSNRPSGVIIYGRHAVLAAIANPERKISKILCVQENSNEVKAVCTQNNINFGIVNVLDRKEIDRITPHEAVHQGFALYAKELETIEIDDIILMSNEVENCHVLILDQVTDPQNIGAIIRSCVAFDTMALVMQDKNSPEENGAMAKASVGTIEILPICRVTNLSRAIQQLQAAGFWTIGMDGNSKTSIEQINRSGKNAIVMGSEGKGMRRLVEENCDMTVKLPISKNVESLNVSTAAAIALYEISKKTK